LSQTFFTTEGLSSGASIPHGPGDVAREAVAAINDEPSIVLRLNRRATIRLVNVSITPGEQNQS
ncbi:MAG: hypothetical protein ACO3R1_05710, partial [Litorivicinaceae bacterium]